MRTKGPKIALYYLIEVASSILLEVQVFKSMSGFIKVFVVLTATLSSLSARSYDLTHEIEGAFDGLKQGFEELKTGLEQTGQELKEKTYPSSQLTFEHKNFEVVGEIHSVKIDLRSTVDVKWKQVDSHFRPRIRVFIFSDPDHVKELSSLFRGLKFRQSGDQISLSTSLLSYACVKVDLNGDMSGKGACYSKVIVEVPEGQKIEVFNQEKKLKFEDSIQPPLFPAAK